MFFCHRWKERAELGLGFKFQPKRSSRSKVTARAVEPPSPRPGAPTLPPPALPPVAPRGCPAPARRGRQSRRSQSAPPAGPPKSASGRRAKVAVAASRRSLRRPRRAAEARSTLSSASALGRLPLRGSSASWRRPPLPSNRNCGEVSRRKSTQVGTVRYPNHLESNQTEPNAASHREVHLHSSFHQRHNKNTTRQGKQVCRQSNW